MAGRTIFVVILRLRGREGEREGKVGESVAEVRMVLFLRFHLVLQTLLLILVVFFFPYGLDQVWS